MRRSSKTLKLTTKVLLSSSSKTNSNYKSRLCFSTSRLILKESDSSSGTKPGVTEEALKVKPEETIFGKIVRGEIECRKVHEDDVSIAFHDLTPRAPIHILIIPKKPMGKLSSATSADQNLLGHLMLQVTKIAESQGIDKTGYRVVINNGIHAQQSVHWLHIHILGGRQFTWPPG